MSQWLEKQTMKRGGPGFETGTPSFCEYGTQVISNHAAETYDKWNLAFIENALVSNGLRRESNTCT